MQKSIFIALEGLDGSGKTTAAKRLIPLLEARFGVRVTLSREPNRAYCGGDFIRDVLEKKIEAFHPRVLPLSFAANRLDHCTRLIGPLLAEPNNIVISDRYYLSSLVYQSSADFDFEAVMNLNEVAIRPDLIFFLNVTNETCYARMDTRNQAEELFEHRLEEHRAKYLEAIDFLQKRGENVMEINGDGTVEETVAQLVTGVEGVLKKDVLR